jgi:hypothetical protein
MGGAVPVAMPRSESAAVHARTLGAHVRAALRESHTGTVHAVFPAPALTSLPANVANALLEQIRGEPRAMLSLALAGNGMVVDLALETVDADAGAFVLRYAERTRVHLAPVEEEAEPTRPVKRRRVPCSQREAEPLPTGEVREHPSKVGIVDLHAR